MQIVSKCQILFSGKSKKNINLSTAELAYTVVTVKSSASDIWSLYL